METLTGRLYFVYLLPIFKAPVSDFTDVDFGALCGTS